MSTPMSEPWPRGVLGPDPGRALRCWVALFLRVGIGLSLLSSGLSGYFGQRGAAGLGNPWGQGLGFGGLDPLFSAIPYLSIGLGLALILGFMTTASSIISAFFSLLTPAFMIVQTISVGSAGGNMNRGMGWGSDPFLMMMTMTMTLPGLIPQAALIWLSPLENHPYSIDALIFGRNEIEPFSPQQRPQPAEPETSPEPVEIIHIGE